MKLRPKHFSTSSLKQKIFIWTFRIVIVAAVVFLFWSQNNLVVTQNLVYSDPNIPKSFVGYKIVHISDLSNSTLNIYNIIKNANPDIILITGGYADSNGNTKNSVKTVNRLTNIAPVYYILHGSDDVDPLKESKAVCIIDSNVELSPKEISANDFIKKVYGKEILNKAEKGDEQSKAYIEYITKALEESKDEKINLFGLGLYMEEGEEYKALNKTYELLGNSSAKYSICLLGNVFLIDEICKTDINMMMFGGTYGINRISNDYKKGVYNNQATQLFVSSGIGKAKNVMRIFNFPTVQVITLSDGTVSNKNPLEKVLGIVFKDIGTIYDNDGGFQETQKENIELKKQK